MKQKKVMIRTIKHQQDSIKGKWGSLGAADHCLRYHGQLDWLHPKTLSREGRYKSRKFRESLKIKRSKWYIRKSNISRYDDYLMKTNTWTHLLRNINDLESALRNQRTHCKAGMSPN